MENQEITILLVEDEGIIAMDQIQTIEAFGYKTLHAQSGVSAIELALSNKNINLILMDIDLNDKISGVDAAKRILSERNIPIVFLTSHSEQEFTKKVKDVTGYGYVIKNSNKFVLKSSIEMALRLFHAHEETVRREETLRQKQKELQQQNSHMTFLRDFAYHISTKKFDQNLPNFFVSELKNFTDAPLITFVEYDEFKKVLITQKIETKKEILNKVMALTNKNLTKVEYLVTDEMYKEITGTVVDVLDTLTECSFGEIPPIVDAFVRSVTGISRFYLLAYIFDNKLYGTTMIGVHKNQPDLSIEFLKSFAHIAASALQRHKAEELLSHSETRFKHIINNLNDVIFNVDLHGTIQFLSDSITTLTGYSKEKLIGTKFIDYIYPADIIGLQNRFKEALEGKLIPYQYRIIKSDGSIIWVKSSSRPMFFNNSNITGLTGVLNDISAEKAAKEKIQNLLNEKDILLKEVHHRIKNNMNIVSSLLSLQARNFEDEKVRVAFQNSSYRVQSMMVLYDKLYKSNNFQSMSLKNYLAPLIKEISTLYSSSNKIKIHQELLEVILPIKILSNIGIIINELLNNSLKHAFINVDSGNIYITTTKIDDQTMKICVEDDGIGYSENIINEENKNFGMQLVNILVQQLHGKFEMKNENGAKFCFRFNL